jgi:hypothetical protein
VKNFGLVLKIIDKYCYELGSNIISKDIANNYKIKFVICEFPDKVIKLIKFNNMQPIIILTLLMFIIGLSLIKFCEFVIGLRCKYFIIRIILLLPTFFFLNFNTYCLIMYYILCEIIGR